MTKKEIMEYAIKGLQAEIENHEKTVNKGRQLIAQIDNGEKPKTTKTRYEIRDIIDQHLEIIEDLDKKKNDLRWEIAMMEAE